MKSEEELKKIEEAIKKTSEELFKPGPKEIEDELREKDTFGNPENLIDRGDDEE